MVELVLVEPKPKFTCTRIAATCVNSILAACQLLGVVQLEVPLDFAIFTQRLLTLVQPSSRLQVQLLNSSVRVFMCFRYAFDQ
jgi:3-deoxy-D-manno-octulosonic-acid transferase